MISPGDSIPRRSNTSRFVGLSASIVITVASVLVLSTNGIYGQGPAPVGAPAGPGGGGARGAFVPEPTPPPQNFATSTDHYQYLHRLHKGGTQHTYATIPKWEGLWSLAGDNGGNTLFLKGQEIIPGMLTPAYEAAFRKRRELGASYDRLTHCEPAGYPRWLKEPYVREWSNSPTQSWWMNDLANETRRIFIGQQHQNIDGTHSPNGDSIGFWVDDMLIVHTIDIYPNDYQRGTPPTSNQFESVEVWRMISMPNGEPRLSVNATFYDPLSLQRPLTATYTFRRNIELEESGYRLRHWECDSNQNTFLVIDDKGRPSTQFRLPGEAGFNDILGVDPRRNPDLPVDLPGQSKNPIFDDAAKK